MSNWTNCMKHTGEPEDNPCYLNNWDKNYPYWYKIIPSKNIKSDCLHDNCSSCDGTGIRKDGLGSCIHMISCSCARCSPRLGFTLIELLSSLLIVVTLLSFIILPLKGCKVNPEQTYRVYNVTDSTGKTYYNLNYIKSNHYRDQQYNDYIFHGNYTVISSTISGNDILKLKAEKE